MSKCSQVLMVRPAHFAYNEQTAVNNAFQQKSGDAAVAAKAMAAFDNMVQLLRNEGVRVCVIQDSESPFTPDSLFPNNWISFHEGTVVLYPMFAANRRAERKPETIAQILDHYAAERMIDLSGYEKEGLFLEGTGSMVLDRANRLAYACRSPRTDEQVLADFCRQLKYRSVIFDAFDEQGQPIYHTNVMMCVADRYVVACTDAIAAGKEKSAFMDAVAESKKEMVPISLAQMEQFAGNMLQLYNEDGEPLLVMSRAAFDSLTPGQIQLLEQYNKLVVVPIAVIERHGGGSVRCMMAEMV